MDNREFFDFDFVDRLEEREIAKKFLEESSSSPHVLWISGDRGVGKTYFIDNVFNKNIEWFLIHVESEKDENDISYISNFIQKLQEISGNKFIDYIKLNYSSFVETGTNITKTILDIYKIPDFGVSDIVSNCIHGFIDFKQQQYTLSKTVAKYIQSIIKKKQKIIFCFDNFTRCSPLLIDIIEMTIIENLSNDNLRFIICTTNEDLELAQFHKNFLVEKIPNVKLNMEPFKKNYFFVEILSKTCEIDEEIRECLNTLFYQCGGYPQRFKQTLINLYTKNGIICREKPKAYFLVDKFKQLLLTESVDFDYESTTFEQKLILTIMSVWKIPFPIEILQSYLEYLLNEFGNIAFLTSSESVRKSIADLINLHIIKIESYCKTDCLKFKHDSLNEIILDLNEDIVQKSYLAFFNYDFLEQKRIPNLQTDYWMLNLDYIRSFQAYYSKRSNWKEVNYEYAVKLYGNGQSYEALQIFNRLNDEIGTIPPRWLIVIAKNLLDCGEFKRSEEMLVIIEDRYLNEISIKEKITVYSMLARTKCHSYDYEQSFEFIDTAIHLSEINQLPFTELLTQKQSIFFVSPGKFEAAKIMFEDLHARDLDHPSMIGVYQSSMDFYEGRKSIELLDKGYQLAQKYDENGLSSSKILHNKGFEHIRCSDFDKAILLTEEARKNFENTSVHYQAYSYNNLAVIEMINGNWQSAVEHLMNAYVWNKNNYIYNIINTNFFVCYSALKDSKAVVYKKELEELISTNSNLDDRIYKKILINLAIDSKNNNDFYSMERYLNLYRPRFQNDVPSGKCRFISLYNNFSSEQLCMPDVPLETERYYKEIEFEPWLTTITHG
ncbi:hypothetical protein [Candidatus Enterococcus clewellii]|uniref:ATPase domain-containing protein n=1 Tax=Candidatus Enterococcus clewellii TaxID=1834193 RepID=A0AAQ3VX51_9ENTE